MPELPGLLIGDIMRAAAYSKTDFTPVQDERRMAFFTRPYEPTPYDRGRKTIPTHDNDNDVAKHTWPVRDEALANRLMHGDTAAETVILNGQAFAILCEVRELFDQASPRADWLKHNGMDISVDSESAFGTGFGADVKRDYGPSEGKLKELWEYGSEPADNGEPWNCTRIKLTEKMDTNLGRAVAVLREAGGLRFNEDGRLTHFLAGKNPDKPKSWLRIIDKTRGPKGKRSAKPVTPPPADIALYDGADLPALGYDFMAGKVGPLLQDGDVTPHTEPGGRDSAHRQTPSSYDAYSTEVAVGRARDAAQAELERYRAIAGRLPYEALLDAATGLHMDELAGGRRGNKQDSARGRTLLQVAIERIVETRCTETA